MVEKSYHTLNSAFPSSIALLPDLKQLTNFQEESTAHPKCLPNTLLVFWTLSHVCIKAQSANAEPLCKIELKIPKFYQKN